MNGSRWGRRLSTWMGLGVAPLLALGIGLGSAPAAADGGNGCQLRSAHGGIHHVINIVFDNTHFRRDNPNVPSDLEQMPHLLNFIEGNGVLLTNHHTPLISHTATDILTSLTGVYGDRHGVPVSNSFRYFNPSGTSNLGVAFAYWTAPIFDPTTSAPTDTTFNMLTANGKNAPAPWVPFTRAGCNFGAVATANTILENVGIDIPTVFGTSSPEAQETATNPKQAFADFVGIGIHCRAGNAVCAGTTGRPDLLPDEPGGYAGFNALFGHKYVAGAIGPIQDLDGNTLAGFPGFDGMLASVSLGYVAAMQEHGVPVTYAYISDAHDNHALSRAFGPGEAGYVAQLQAYDQAFAKFFMRLANDGIDQSNTLFVFTSDEGDHFVGGPPSPDGCDGVSTPCTYSQIGELSVNTTGLLATQAGITTPFAMHSDVAPTFYITGNPARDALVTRNFERGVGRLTAQNLLTGNTDLLPTDLADPVEMKLLHMVTGDPARTPTFTMFANPDYFLTPGPPNCSSPCVTENPKFAWNHGTTSRDITTTWLGLVGPGVQSQGQSNDVWSDHTDTRPTALALVGLTDDYAHQGRALFEVMTGWAVPAAVAGRLDTTLQLAQSYKQINAPVGPLGLATLSISTQALSSGDPSNDAAYAQMETLLAQFTVQRDALAIQMEAALDGATFGNQPIDGQLAASLVSQAQVLLTAVRDQNSGP